MGTQSITSLYRGLMITQHQLHFYGWVIVGLSVGLSTKKKVGLSVGLSFFLKIAMLGYQVINVGLSDNPRVGLSSYQRIRFTKEGQ